MPTPKRVTKPCPECGISLHIDAVKCKCNWSDIRHAATVSRQLRYSCTAYGCCLPGSIFANAQEIEGWCYIHHAHRESLDIQALTAAINRRQELFDAAYRIIKEVGLVDWWGQIPAEYAKPFRQEQRGDLLPTQIERRGTIANWLARVRRDLEIEILRELGIDVRSGQKRVADEARTYAPSEDDIEARRLAEAAILDGSWKKPNDLLGAA